MRFRDLIILSFLVVFSSTAFAQNEVLREVNSLAGIQQFGITVSVEQPEDFDDIRINPGAIKKAVLEKLTELNVRIIGDQELKGSSNFPMLILHINMMEVGNGTYPFASDLTFYQPVKLSLNRDLETMAITWQTSTVGLVSLNQFEVLPNASIDLVYDFIRDYKKVN